MRTYFKKGDKLTVIIIIKKCNAKVNVAPIKNKYIDLKCNNVFEPLIIKDDEVINWIL